MFGGAGNDSISGYDGYDHIYGGDTYSGLRLRDPGDPQYKPPANDARWAMAV